MCIYIYTHTHTHTGPCIITYEFLQIFVGYTKKMNVSSNKHVRNFPSVFFVTGSKVMCIYIYIYIYIYIVNLMLYFHFIYSGCQYYCLL